PPEAMSAIAEILGIAAAEVREVASFYTMFARKPIGRHHLQVCIGMCCRLRGGDAILDHLKALLRIDVGETTDDDAFHLSAVECLGSCGTAPMMQVDDEYYEDLTTERVDEIVARLKEA
ncbi:MAG: NAD(P)H-dependent oxidoreductase subunit E, partial [Gammaproteobacteria bacterium]|nr:NAD(P)H-dependent oxidoreductase subunit E [Gammaproteobacteria bacterium]